MADDTDAAQSAELRKEHDLYLRLLRLGEHEVISDFAGEVLTLMVEATGAQRGYIELRNHDDPADLPAWSTGHACNEEMTNEIRAKVSRGIISESIAHGRTISTASALLDPRFSELGSVQKGKIEAVLCGPIGSDPPLGVIYLEGRTKPGPFAEADRERVEILGRLVAPFADRLLARFGAQKARDATAEVRKLLRLDGVVGHSQAMAGVLHQVAQVARLDVDVLLTGESGTGKSQLAQVLHNNSPRMNQPFVELNCAAIPDTVFENELFGHAAGAYTGASSAAQGKAAAADRGTLFLDEVGEIPVHLQAKLLQLLQSRRFHPLGATRSIAVDVRVIAATNSDLEQKVRDKRFRADLYYRLRVMPIHMPSLVERRDDVADLALAFCQGACKRHGFAPITLSRAALRAVEAANWPGNIRELGHAIEASVIRAVGSGAHSVEPAHVFPQRAGRAALDAGEETFESETRRFQRDLILRSLEATDWNIAETARRLDIVRSHLYNLIKTHGLVRKTPG